MFDVAARMPKKNNRVKNVGGKGAKLIAKIAIEKNASYRHNSSITRLFLGLFTHMTTTNRFYVSLYLSLCFSLSIFLGFTSCCAMYSSGTLKKRKSIVKTRFYFIFIF